MFIVTVPVMHCWLCYSTNHIFARCHIHTAPAGVVVLGLGLGHESQVLGLALRVKSLANQVLDLARLVIFCQTNTATMLKSTFIA